MKTTTSRTKNSFRPLTAAVMMLTIAACATAAGKPGWLENPESEYPASTYLTAPGEGEDLDGAAANATANLSAIFQSEVEAVTRVYEKLEESEQGSSLTAMTDIDIVVKSAQVIEGVQIRERWKDRKGKHYALAVLDRDEAGRILTERLRDNEGNIRTTLDFAASADSPLEAARAIRPIVELALKRDIQAAQYNLISGNAWNESPTTARIQALRKEAIAAATFSVDAQIIEEESGQMKPNRTFARTLGDVVNEAGFRVSQADDGTMLITSRITLSEPFERGNNNWKHYLWDVSVEMSANDSSARAFLVVEDSGSTSNPSRSTAKRGAIQQAEAAILRRFENEFSEYLSQSE